MWWMLAAAGAEPADRWIDLVRLATVRDGIRLAPEELAARIGRACDGGIDPACALVGVDPRDRPAIGRALARGCEAGDAASCLGVAFASLPLVDGTPDVAHPPDPIRYRQTVEAACRAGVGCIEVGWVHLLGIDTYPNPPEARRRWTALCDEGDPSACTAVGNIGGELGWLEEGEAGGDPLALLALGAMPGGPSVEAWRRACDDGATAACVALAPHLADPIPDLARACALGDSAACALGLRHRGATGEVPASEVADGLWSWCPEVPSACVEATFIDQGASVIGSYRGRQWKNNDADRLVRYYAEDVQRCNLAALGRNASATGYVHAALRIGDDGDVKGAWFEDPLDPEHGDCLTSALIGKHGTRPVNGEVRADVVIPAFHGARVMIDTEHLDGFPDATLLMQDVARWAEPLDDCLLRYEVPEPNIRMELRFEANGNGSASDVSVSATSEVPKVDRCVADWVASHVVSNPVRWATRMRARVEFLSPRSGPAAVTEPAVDPAWQVHEPTTVRVLALAVTDATIQRRRVTFGSRTVAAIEEGHHALGQWVDRATGGAVRLDTTVRTVSASVGGLGVLEDVPDLVRWDLQARDLPQEVLDAIEPGRWDSVFLWVPIPSDADRPLVGTTLPLTVRGATVSVMALPAKSELRATPLAPALELPLHEWWHQLELRAELLLGLEWLPSNHEALETASRSLDPRTWVDPGSHTVMGWYREVLGGRVHPDLWRDLFDPGDSVRENLASKGRPIGGGVFDVDGVTDTRVVAGGFSNVPRGDPETEEEVWFGVEWDEPVRAGRVVTHLGNVTDPERPSFRGGVLEAVTVDDARTWLPLPAEVTVDGTVTTYTFAPTGLLAVRVRVVDGSRAPTCREIEVHPR